MWLKNRYARSLGADDRKLEKHMSFSNPSKWAKDKAILLDGVLNILSMNFFKLLGRIKNYFEVTGSIFKFLQNTWKLEIETRLSLLAILLNKIRNLG